MKSKTSPFKNCFKNSWFLPEYNLQVSHEKEKSQSCWGSREGWGTPPQHQLPAARKRGRFSFHSKSFCIFSSFVLVSWYICKHNTCSKIHNWNSNRHQKEGKLLFSDTFEKTATPNQGRLLHLNLREILSACKSSMVTASNNLFWFPNPRKKSLTWTLLPQNLQKHTTSWNSQFCLSPPLTVCSENPFTGLWFLVYISLCLSVSCSAPPLPLNFWHYSLSPHFFPATFLFFL